MHNDCVMLSHNYNPAPHHNDEPSTLSWASIEQSATEPTLADYDRCRSDMSSGKGPAYTAAERASAATPVERLPTAASGDDAGLGNEVNSADYASAGSPQPFHLPHHHYHHHHHHHHHQPRAPGGTPHNASPLVEVITRTDNTADGSEHARPTSTLGTSFTHYPYGIPPSDQISCRSPQQRCSAANAAGYSLPCILSECNTPHHPPVNSLQPHSLGTTLHTTHYGCRTPSATMTPLAGVAHAPYQGRIPCSPYAARSDHEVSRALGHLPQGSAPADDASQFGTTIVVREVPSRNHQHTPVSRVLAGLAPPTPATPLTQGKPSSRPPTGKKHKASPGGAAAHPNPLHFSTPQAYPRPSMDTPERAATQPSTMQQLSPTRHTPQMRHHATTQRSTSPLHTDEVEQYFSPTLSIPGIVIPPHLMLDPAVNDLNELFDQLGCSFHSSSPSSPSSEEEDDEDEDSTTQPPAEETHTTTSVDDRNVVLRIKKKLKKRIRQRQKQIEIGKLTSGYYVYSSAVPVEERQYMNRMHPITPRAQYRSSKRAFDAAMRAWRRAVHQWDTAEEQQKWKDQEKALGKKGKRKNRRRSAKKKKKYSQDADGHPDQPRPRSVPAQPAIRDDVSNNQNLPFPNELTVATTADEAACTTPRLLSIVSVVEHLQRQKDHGDKALVLPDQLQVQHTSLQLSGSRTQPHPARQNNSPSSDSFGVSPLSASAKPQPFASASPTNGSLKCTPTHHHQQQHALGRGALGYSSPAYTPQLQLGPNVARAATPDASWVRGVAPSPVMYGVSDPSMCGSPVALTLPTVKVGGSVTPLLHLPTRKVDGHA